MGEHVAGDLRPVDHPPGIAGELVEEDMLTARVHVTERMDRRRLTPHPRQPIRERIHVQVAQVVALGERTKHALRLGNDELRAAMRNAGAAGMGVGGANLATPGVHILRQVGVDRLQVRQIVATSDGVLA
ncbi:hypothetical protein O1A05_03950 [Citricoccus sp. NR2]|nr:hypothetical protein [Citricoccus sp. NR2]WBL19857.1 hypothetical protein O1A05_03950 [Citricoccus sp. NR2]